MTNGSGTPLERLLIVTDDQAVRDELRFGFGPNTDITLAIDAREASSKMNDSVPSAVVVDLQTGSAGGFGLARDMSEDSRLANVPVILLLERPQDAWLAKQAGASAYLVKPVTAGRLVRVISSAAQ